MKEKLRENRLYILIIFGILVFNFVFFKFIVEPIQVSGPSMNPNLHNGERVWAFKPATIKRGSVIVFYALGTDPTQDKNIVYVKRVIGLPGDKISSRNGKLTVNGKEVNQSYISQSAKDGGTGNWKDFKELAGKKDATWKESDKKNLDHIPQNSYFVLGDNREVSNDSRYFGYVPQSKVIGVVKEPWFFFGGKRYEINRYYNDFFLDKQENKKPTTKVEKNNE